LIASRALERQRWWRLFAELELMRLIASDFFAKFGELAGGLVLELIALISERAPTSEFRAQLVLVGLISAIDSASPLEPPGRQPHPRVMHSARYQPRTASRPENRSPDT